MTALTAVPGHDTVELWLESPILSRAALAALAAELDRLRSDPRAVILACRHPVIFLAGAHLAEIAALDAATAGPYAVAGRAVLERVRSHPRPVVAAIHGLCAGGGFDLALACDALAVGPAARFAHPGVRRGLVTGWGGTAHLPATLPRTVLQAALLQAREVTNASFSCLIDSAPNATKLMEHAADVGRRLARVEPRRFKLWRELQSADSIDSFRAVVVLTEGVAAEAPSPEAPRHGRQKAS